MRCPMSKNARLGICLGDAVRSVEIWRYGYPGNMFGLLRLYKNSEEHARACIELGSQKWPWSSWHGSLAAPADEHPLDDWPGVRFWDYLWHDGCWHWRLGLNWQPWTPIP